MKILFVGLDYYIYTRAIAGEMEAQGATVRFVDIMPRSLPQLVMRTVRPAAFNRFLAQHHDDIISMARQETFDQVVFLQVHQMSVERLAALRAAQPQARFTLYNWDAISNHDYLEHAPYFDRVLTFDPADARAHGFGYLPLFCVRSLQGLRRDIATPKSLYMVGNIVMRQRYDAVEAFRAYSKTNGITFRQHLKITPVVLARLMRGGLRPRGLSLRSIGDAALRKMIETSVGAFDFANHNQAGQTMRMMENLCAGKKIVTSSQTVRAEPFYSPDRIHIFDGQDFSGVADFLETPIADTSRMFPEYHIQNFTRSLLGLA